jgi:murein DD-endopeptidase MepM/ murein hydrolase activator NlpD
MRLLAVLAALGVLGFVGWRAEPFRPTVTLDDGVITLGRSTPILVTARDRGQGLARVEIAVATPDGNVRVLADETFPGRGWRGSGVHEAVVAPAVDAAAAALPEGPAELRVTATDHSWLAALRAPATAARPVTIDLTPPTVVQVSIQHVARRGGAECLVYRVSADTVSHGIDVGGTFFPGSDGVFADETLRVALFPLPPDQPDARPVLVVTDAAGNDRRVNGDIVVKPRQFREDSLTITDEFIAGKITPLLVANQLPQDGNPVEGYLRVNRDLRASTEARVRSLCAASARKPLWQGAFLRLPNSAPLAGFGDRRTYLYGGKVIDHQTHLGFDLASLKRSPVPAGNAGRVVFAGPLGIYGDAVILDHGLGLFSLYGHLSEIAVAKDAMVERGAIIGKTGESGLAGGDHLHWSVMIHGVHVDPTEWLDGHWITDHVDARLAVFPRAPS